MRAGRVIRRVLLGLVAAVAVAAAVAYLLASRIPEGYRPARLSREQKSQQVQHFVHEGLRFMDEGRLPAEELITHVAKPEECLDIYNMLADRPQGSLGVVFEW